MGRSQAPTAPSNTAPPNTAFPNTAPQNTASLNTASPSLSRRERQASLQERLRENPFLTDEELARAFSVSVQTIRLDRLSLRIPELRERTREVAQRVLGMVRSLSSSEIVGDLVDIRLGESGVSVLETGPEMAFLRTGIVRGQFIFAQAESLALALVDAPVALTGLANIKFKRPVRVGEKLLARAEVIRSREKRLVVQVVTRSRGEQVFRGKFVVFSLAGTGAANEEEGGREE